MQKNRQKELFESLLNSGISEKVVRAMENVKRELFMKDDSQDQAYDDNAMPIGHGQTISQPYTVAFMTDLLDVKQDDKILEIGTGSGYQTAVLYQLCKNIYTVERLEPLAMLARQRFIALDMHILQFVADGSNGWQEYAPYTKILVTAAAPKIPQVLIDQLAPNGTLVIPVGERKLQTMLCVTKDADGKIAIEEQGKFRFVPLIGQHAWKNTHE